MTVGENSPLLADGRIDRWLALQVFHPAVHAFCRLTGWNSFRLARVAVAVGWAMATIGIVASCLEMEVSIVCSALLLAVMLRELFVYWAAMGLLERSFGEGEMDALPIPVVRAARRLMSNRMIFLMAAFFWEGYGLLIGTRVWEVVALGMVILSAGCYWATAFVPPGKGARQRIAERLSGGPVLIPVLARPGGRGGSS
jgi:hypothetical protein